ncbi:MAG: hypothetical protein QY328_04365 [Anaerolineales bacterium]|nr:MAG: hypothetical protein QY328_04365 [Anaerolineales bacterium]
MDNKTKGIIATVAAVLLCGCPGLFLCFFGSTMAMAGMTPGADIDVFGSNDPAAATTMGFVFLCLSLLFIATPFGVGFAMFRKKPAATPVSDEPLPPTS